MVSELKVEFLFDFGSPNAFLCHRAIPAVERRTGIRFEYVPVLLGGIFKATGNQSPAVQFQSVRNKPEYQRLEIARFITKHDIKGFGYSPYFPINSLFLMRGAIAARAAGVFEHYVEVMFHHMWVVHQKLDEPAVIAQVLKESGFDSDALMQACSDPRVKTELLENTERAVARGAFGSPTFFVEQDMWFGKEHLRDVEEEIGKRLHGK
jgi:2-hydroxychromene-2-carboxylate isomerase